MSMETGVEHQGGQTLLIGICVCWPANNIPLFHDNFLAATAPILTSD